MAVVVSESVASRESEPLSRLLSTNPFIHCRAPTLGPESARNSDESVRELPVRLGRPQRAEDTPMGEKEQNVELTPRVQEDLGRIKV